MSFNPVLPDGMQWENGAIRRRRAALSATLPFLCEITSCPGNLVRDPVYGNCECPGNYVLERSGTNCRCPFGLVDDGLSRFNCISKYSKLITIIIGYRTRANIGRGFNSKIIFLTLLNGVFC